MLSTIVLAEIIISPDNVYNCLAYQSLGVPNEFCFALDGASAKRHGSTYILFSPFPQSMVINYFWKNDSTAIFKIFCKGHYYYDNLIILCRREQCLVWWLGSSLGLLQYRLITKIYQICQVLWNSINSTLHA